MWRDKDVEVLVVSRALVEEEVKVTEVPPWASKVLWLLVQADSYVGGGRPSMRSTSSMFKV